jgi:lipopolysaccharide assembly outer membrane protein LptD (OstA)
MKRLGLALAFTITPVFAQDQSIKCIPTTAGANFVILGPDGQRSKERIIYAKSDYFGDRPPATWSADSKTVVEAVVMLKGNVEIKTDNMTLRADAAEYHVCTGEIVARGNVYIKPVTKK